MVLDLPTTWSHAHPTRDHRIPSITGSAVDNPKLYPAAAAISAHTAGGAAVRSRFARLLERADELVEDPVGQLALDAGAELVEVARVQQPGRLRQALADLQVRLAVQIGRLDVADTLRLTAGRGTAAG